MFGPAKYLMNRLRFAPRFVLFGAMFSVIIAVLLWRGMAAEYEAIAQARTEQAGAEHLVALRQVLEPVQQHRGLVGTAKAGDAKAAEASIVRRAAVDEAFRREAARLADRPREAEIRSAWLALAGEWDRLKVATPALAADESFQRHTALIRKLLSRGRASADR